MGAGNKSMTLQRETYMLALGVKSHHRLVCKKMSKGFSDYVASAAAIHVFCLALQVVILCLSVRDLG